MDTIAESFTVREVSADGLRQLAQTSTRLSATAPRRSLPWRGGNNLQSLRAMLRGPGSESSEGGELTKKEFPDFRSIS
jgi:hypothetical protein